MAFEILLIDDELLYRDILVENLCPKKYSFTYANCLNSATKLIKRKRPHIILLDWNLKKESGIDLIKIVKSNPNTANIPVIMFTGNILEAQMIEALDCGADDYVQKPFNLKYLISKIQANLRKYNADPNKQIINDVVFDENQLLIYIKEKEYSFRRKEFLILKEMFLAPDKCFSRKELNKITSGENVFVSDRCVDTFIRYIRKKVDCDLIQTVHRKGYKINHKCL